MSEHFGPAAARLSGLAARHLGWRPGEFWSATPAELGLALAPAETLGGESLDRRELQTLMDREHGR